MSLLTDKLPPLWEMNASLQQNTPLTAWLQKHIRSAVASAQIPAVTAADSASLSTKLYQNLVSALVALQIVEAAPAATAMENGHDRDEDNDDEEEEDTPNRRPKKRRKAPIRRLLVDPHKIWFQSNSSSESNGDNENDEHELWNDSQDDIPDTVGGKLAIVSVGGLLNGLAGHVISHTPNAHPKTLFVQAVASGVAAAVTASLGVSVTIVQLHAVATNLHAAIAHQVSLDILRTTPQRIHLLLAADLSSAEFASVRRRVYETVAMGRGGGMHQSAADAQAAADALPTAASSAVHDIEKFHKCPVCGNNEPADFILDRKNGDLICSHCGTVVSESIMHEGSQFRKFEGEVDRNHHGDAANPLYSNAHNMGTSLSGVAPVTGAGIGGWGSGGSGASGGKRNLETILKNAHAYTELNVSQFGKTDRRTRIGYKDRQKKEAFLQMTHAGDALNLHEAVVQRAKELFAGTCIITLERVGPETTPGSCLASRNPIKNLTIR
jgi:TFIIB zinc-binding